jgi:hypothetical protein
MSLNVILSKYFYFLVSVCNVYINLHRMSFCLSFVDFILERHESSVNILGKGRGGAGRKCSIREHVTTLYTCRKILY